MRFPVLGNGPCHLAFSNVLRSETPRNLWVRFGADMKMKRIYNSPENSRMSPEKGPFQKENSLSTSIFQVHLSCFFAE